MWCKDNLSKEFLLEQYVYQGKSMAEIARETGFTAKTVKANLITKGIEIRKRAKSGLTKDVLLREYVDNNKSTRLIGKEFGVSHNSVLLALKKYDIPRRSCSRLGSPNLRSPVYKNMISIGDKFGKLTTVRKLDEVKEKWNCLCDCGSNVVVSHSDLLRNRVKSCGCLKNKKQVGYCEITGGLVSKYRIGARRRNIFFDINAKDMWELLVKQQKKCAVSGVLINVSDIGERTASLDRIDSCKGYTVDNIQWVHKAVNLMKQTMSNKDFVEWCKIIADNQRKLAIDWEH